MVSVAGERSVRTRVRWGAALALAALAAVALWFRGGDVFGRQYEYEEELTLRLDGSATLRVNASLAALAALRGLDVDPAAGVDRERIRAAYESPAASVVSVPRPWRRRGRDFVQINLQVPDVRRLHEAPPFAWSRYELVEQDGTHVYRQTVGPSALRPGTLQNVGWDGREIVGFRLHLPSRILEHNARDLERDEPTGVARGNILAWEQHLSDRLDGQPLRIEVRMESRSILYLTLWLFAGAFTAAVLALGALAWWVGRREPRSAHG